MNCRSRGWFFGDLELNIRGKGNTGCHVATSQRRYAWSTEESQQETQRRNVAMSQRHHDFCTNIIKCKGRPNFQGIEELTDESTKSRAAVTGIIGEDTSFCISSFLQIKLLMFSRLIMCILKSSMF